MFVFGLFGCCYGAVALWRAKFGAYLVRVAMAGYRLRDREAAHVIVKSSGKRNWPEACVYLPALPRAPGQLPIAHAWRCGDAAASRVVE